VDTNSNGFFVEKIYPKLLIVGSHMCHQLPERSFFFGIRKYPVCARCTGIHLATPLGLLASLLPVVWWAFLPLLIPTAIDGLTQLLTSYSSTNRRRLITGLLFGLGYGALLAIGGVFVFTSILA